MPALALAVMAIAVPDSLNPSLIAAAIYLSLGQRPFRRTLAFTIAAFAVTLAGGIVIALGLGDLVLSLLPKPSKTVKWRVLTAVGIVLIFGGVVVWWRRGSLGATAPSESHEPRTAGSPGLMGAGIAGIELVTAFPYFAAIAMVVGSSVTVGHKLFLIVLYNIVYVMPLIAIVIVCAAKGDRAGRLLAPVRDWIDMRWPIVVAPLLEAAGIGLTAYGIVQLT